MPTSILSQSPARRNGSFARILSLTISLMLLLVLDICTADSIAEKDKVEYVIAISVDGLVPNKVLGLPNFQRLRSESAFTDNARNQFLSSQTTPNHASMLTGLSIEEHKYKMDGDNGKKVGKASVFDLVKAAGGKTCLFAQKEKFQLFQRSWPIDRFKWSKENSEINNAFFKEMKSTNPCNYVLLHWREPDLIGHRYKGADTKHYKQAVQVVDRFLGQVFQMIDTSSRFQGNTAIVLTTDHGFGGENHSERDNRGNYQIPFYIWGPGVKPGDLYELNKTTRKDPGKNRPPVTAGLQPIRNQDSAVVSADYLGLYSEVDRFQRHKLDLAVGSSSSEQDASNQDESLAPTPISVENADFANTTKVFTFVRPTPTPTLMPSTSPAASSALTDGYILFIQDFSKGNGFLGLERMPDPTAPDLGPSNALYVGKMELRSVKLVPRSVRAEYDAKHFGGILLKGSTVLRLRSYVLAPDLLNGKDDVEFRMIIRTSSGATIRGEKRKLSQITAYDALIDISQQPAGTTIEQIRLKATNYALRRPAFTIFIAGVQVEKVLE
eukprot:CAMPEP_0181062636 /NCGR_PEP_ID=MMETSP1070-20121207/23186_1 /TAXON_ID=265543 /ORGANISM="Minutocellus polymorphus, Strain NH13" /LENGTH=551 /DNA_ID=CAMNT_0023142723 /DNA_START=27 /DNA_END=1682 /DNA_ORIENTATION=-